MNNNRNMPKQYDQPEPFLSNDIQSQNSISGSIERTSENQSQQFSNRFQGKQDYMTKDGHYGIVKNTKNPVQKMTKPLSTNLITNRN